MKSSYIILKSKKNLVLLILVLVSIFLYYLFFYDPFYNGRVLHNHNKILIAAHGAKGFSAPEETIRATREAFTCGIDIVDLDAHVSLDGQIVIFHDFILDKKTTGTGLISQKTIKEIRSVKLKQQDPMSNSDNEEISTLEDFLKQFYEKKEIFIIELKIPGVRPTGVEEEIDRILSKYKAYDRVQIGAYNPFVLYRLKKINQKIITVFVFTDTNYKELPLYTAPRKDNSVTTFLLDSAWYLKFQKNNPVRRLIIKITKPDILAINYNVNEKIIDNQLSRNWPVILWVVNKQKDITWAISKNPYAVVSDKPLKFYKKE